MPDQSPSEIRIALVQGSVRPGNYTAKALALVADELLASKSFQVDVIDPTGVALSMSGSGTDPSEAERFAETIRNAVGLC